MATLRVSKSLAPLRSPTPDVGLLFGGGTGAAASDLTSVVGVGIASIAHGKVTGEYRVKLADQYAKLLDLIGVVIDATTPDDWEVVLLSEAVKGAVVGMSEVLYFDALPAEGATVTINGVSFTAAAAEDLVAGEFGVGSDINTAVDSLAACVNRSTNAAILGKVRASPSAAADSVTLQFITSNDALFGATSYTNLLPNPRVSTTSSSVRLRGLKGVQGVCARNSITLVVANLDVDDTVTLNGVAFTAKAAEDLDARQFDISGTDTAAATSLAACINAARHESIAGLFYATSAAGVVSIRCQVPGRTDYALASNDADGAVVLHAKFVGGADSKDIIIMVFKGGAAADLTTDEKLRLCVAVTNSARSY